MCNIIKTKTELSKLREWKPDYVSPLAHDTAVAFALLQAIEEGKEALYTSRGILQRAEEILRDDFGIRFPCCTT